MLSGGVTRRIDTRPSLTVSHLVHSQATHGGGGCTVIYCGACSLEATVHALTECSRGGLLSPVRSPVPEVSAEPGEPILGPTVVRWTD